MFYWLLREEDVCPGPDLCPWTVEKDTRCQGCAGGKLEVALDTAAGLALKAALDLDFALSKHIGVTLDEITMEEFRLLKMIHFERARREKEKT